MDTQKLEKLKKNVVIYLIMAVVLMVLFKVSGWYADEGFIDLLIAGFTMAAVIWIPIRVFAIRGLFAAIGTLILLAVLVSALATLINGTVAGIVLIVIIIISFFMF